MPAAWYPRAAAQDFLSKYPELFAGRQMSNVSTLVLHTTEGTGWPDYARGTMAPTFTYHPRTHELRQHIPVNYAARALADAPGGIRPNWAGCAQLEVIGTSGWSPALTAAGWLIDNLDTQALDDIASLIRWLHTEWQLPLTAYPWTARRMTGVEFTAFTGICGHMHVPENDHSDPGPGAPVVKLLTAAGGTEENEMDAVQANQLQQLYNAVFSGGPSMVDDGHSISQSLADIHRGQAAASEPPAIDVDAIAAAITAKVAASIARDVAAQLIVAPKEA